MVKQVRQISIISICLLLTPWSIVAVTYTAYHYSARPILFNVADLRELRNLHDAVRRYHVRYGEYPPDFSSNDVRREIEEHLAKIFPLRNAALDTPVSVEGLGPHNALYFWLQGFSTDTEFPLTGHDRGWNPFFEFKIARMDGDAYRPLAGQAPYVYFRADRYLKSKCDQLPQHGTARPYARKITSARIQFAEPTAFQIISAGVDDNYGTDRIITTNTSVGAHVDNLANFTARTTIGDSAVAYRRATLLQTCRMSLFAAVFCSLSFPILVLSKRAGSGVARLRDLVATQAGNLQSEQWREVLKQDRKKRKLRAMARIGRRG